MQLARDSSAAQEAVERFGPNECQPVAAQPVKSQPIAVEGTSRGGRKRDEGVTNFQQNTTTIPCASA